MDKSIQSAVYKNFQGMMRNPLLKSIFALFVFFTLDQAVFAATGVNTASSSLASVTTWIQSWMPAICTIAIMIFALLWAFQVIPMVWFVRMTFAMIVIGTAAYLVAFFMS